MRTKKEAAAYLGVSVRALERYAAQGKLSVSYSKGTRGQVATFDDQELDRLKAQLAQPVYPQRPAVEPRPDKPTSTGSGEPVGESLALATVGDRLASVLEVLRPNLQPAPVAIADKIMLTITEAAALTNLSRSHLAEALRAGALKGRILGRGWKIKRDDLNRYIESL